ncbi:phosphorylase family protein [Streptomyces sp. 8N616]|uniref:phosphorylase family protein n=1 Tax=Streptomyces sp. 8N616 TaxID=3457414 RepID=UPI003FD43131
MSDVNGRGTTLVVLTALEVEYQSVRAHLGAMQQRRHPAGTLFDVGHLPGTPWQIALTEIGDGNQGAAVLTERAIALFHPRALFFVGVAGALKDDIQLGDVVVATHVYAYHGGKDEDGEFLARPRLWTAPHELEQLARDLRRTARWTHLLPQPFLDLPPRVHLDPIAAGEVVLNSAHSALREQLRRHYQDAAAIEMESAGAAQAAQLNHGLPALTVRGISDKADGDKHIADGVGWQSTAARNAAAFAFSVIRELPAEYSAQDRESAGKTSDHGSRARYGAAAATTPPNPPPPDMAPALPKKFTPRADEGGRLLTALRKRETDVALCGPGGFGKTALASWACEEVRDWFPQGLLWAELGQRPGADRIVRSLAGLASHLSGSPPGIYADVMSAAQALRSALTGRRVLLVVDDVWSATDLRPFLGLGDEVTLLVTTRRAGLLKGTEIPVGDMSGQEAVAMLGVEQADGDALLPLLRRTGHWPLALALISDLMRSLLDRHDKSVPQAVSELVRELDEQGIPTLDDLTDNDAVNGIVRTLELSLEDLVAAGGDECEERFTSLATFPPGETIPYRLLHRLWNVSEVRARAEGDRFVGRSLASAVGAEGLRLHDVTREALRRIRARHVSESGVRLLDMLRPAQGWHQLADEDWSFADSLAFHLQQAGLTEELGDTLRDMRFLSRRLAASGPTATDADLVRYNDVASSDTGARALTELIRREGHLLTGGLSAHDLALTLENRSWGSLPLRQWLRHSGQARMAGGLRALHAPPDLDHAALVRSSATSDSGEFRDIDWHPQGRLLAVAGTEPSLEIIDVDHAWTSVGSVDPPVSCVNRARWSPDGTRLALLGLGDRFATEHNDASTAQEAPGILHYDLSVYDMRTSTEIKATPVEAHPLSLKAPALCWSPDSRTLAVARDTDVCLWDPATDAGLRPLTGCVGMRREGEVSLTWHPDHGLLAHTPAEQPAERHVGVLRRWPDPAQQHCEPEVWRDPSLRGPGSALTWRPDGSSAALEVEGAVVVVDPLARRVLWQHEHHQATTVHWSPDGERLALREAPAWLRQGNATLTLWDMPTDSDMARGAVPTPSPTISLSNGHTEQDSVAWRPDGTALATTSDRRVLQIWRAEPQGSADNLSPHRAAMQHVRWGPDSQTLAVAGADSRWLTLSLAAVQGPSVRICQTFPFSGRDPATRQQWVDKVGVPAEQRPRGGPPIIVQFAPSDQLYLIGRWFQPLRLFTADGQLVTEFDSPADAQRWGDACFTPSGDRIIAAAGDRTWHETVFSVWPVTGGARQPASASSMHGDTRPGASRMIWRVAASETHAALLAKPGYIGLFRLCDMQPVCWIRTNSHLHDASFDPSGRYLAVAGDAGLHFFAVHDPSRD